MRRQRIAWLVTVPLALMGSETAHAAADAIFGSPTGRTGELFEGAGPGADLVPAFVALALAVVVLALTGRVAGVWSSSHRAALAGVPFALLAPAVFVVQEHLELLLHTGRIPLGAALEPGFLPGFALQLPFALTGYLVARILLRLADGVRELIARRTPRRPRDVARVPPRRPGDEAPRVRRHAWAHSGRAPPASAGASS